jgi:hypothetical protein
MFTVAGEEFLPIGSLVRKRLAPSPIQCLLAVRKRAHLDGPAIADGVNVRKLYVMPFAGVLGADMGMNKNYNPAATVKESSGLLVPSASPARDCVR